MSLLASQVVAHQKILTIHVAKNLQVVNSISFCCWCKAEPEIVRVSPIYTDVAGDYGEVVQMLAIQHVPFAMDGEYKLYIENVLHKTVKYICPVLVEGGKMVLR